MSHTDFCEALLKKISNRGIDVRGLEAVLEVCEFQDLDEGRVLCREKRVGEECYFLLSGSVSVVKVDPRGRLHELAILQAPSLFGHMALVDGTARSATCMARTSVELAVLARDTYSSLLHEKSLAGRALRRLLLSSLAQQLTAGNARLFSMIESEDEESGGDQEAEDELMRATGALQGWSGDSPGEAQGPK